jgi:homoaconitase/3-isopropylmalate dehydratase large subunit
VRTLLDKMRSEHVIVPCPGGEELLFVDLNLVHEGGTFLAFDRTAISCRAANARLRRTTAISKGGRDRVR